MAAETMPAPPDARSVMEKLVVVGSIFEQMEKAAGDVAAEVVAYRADYAQWECDVAEWAKRQAEG